MPEKTRPTLTITQGPALGTVFELEKDSLTLGRDIINDIVIEAAAVSRNHARLSRQGASFILEDLSSTNGTFVNGQRLTQPHLLHSGDTVRLGKSIELVYQALEASQAKPTVLAGGLELAGAPPPLATISAGVAATAGPQQLLVEQTDGTRQTISLQGESLTLGRAAGSDIQLSAEYVSRAQARLEKTEGGYRLVPLPEAMNPLFHKGRPLTEAHDLVHGDVFRLPGSRPGEMLTLSYFDWSALEEVAAPISISFIERARVTIGRDPGNDVQLDNPLVSRYHAEVERLGTRYRLRDLSSTNGTFVNGQRIEGQIWLEAEDVIRIGSTRFTFALDALQQVDEAGGLNVEALHLNKWVRKNLNLLQDISLSIQPREFVAIVGLSGSGKTTLVDALAGYRPATDGQVLVNGMNLYRHFDAVRNEIGYVPQRDIIHMELTVFEALNYAAQLRMPADTASEERGRRVEEVMADMGLSERRDLQVARLSGGQQKRVSIGVELLTKPGLFFLDEPTSGLDPGTETALMQLLRNLADQGRTILLITHATKNVMLADKVIFLVRGGYVAWYGPPDEALTYFDQFRSERERRAESMEFDTIYNILEDPSKGRPQDWDERYRSNPAYARYIAAPLGLALPAPAEPVAPPRAISQPPRSTAARRASGFRQFLLLSSRNLKILFRDRFSLLLMLLSAPLLSLLDFLIAPRDIFDRVTGDTERVTASLFFLPVTAIFVGALAQMREIVKETDIYRRERLVILKITPYVLSKVWVAALLAFYQAGVFLAIRYLAVDMPGDVSEAIGIYFTLVLASLAGMMLGLFISALSPTPNAAPLLTVLFLIPQIILGGGFLPVASLGAIGESLSRATSSRWAFEALVTQTGFGRDVADDPCWQLPSVEREALASEYKDENCTCMGAHLFERCDFPGLMDFYNEAVRLSEPVRPAEPQSPGDPPPQPEYPATPTPMPTPVQPQPPKIPSRSAQQYYQSALDRYMHELEAYNDQMQEAQDEYNDQIEAIRDQYEADIEAYQEKIDQFKVAQNQFEVDMDIYEEDYAEWQQKRSEAVAGAEGMLDSMHDRYGALYVVNLPSRWLYQGIIIVSLFGLTLALQKRKDVI